jgi:hypothetical protein
MKKGGTLGKNAQAAMEFLMTYGWAIMVVLVAIGALAFFGVLNPDKFIPSRCALEPGIGCMDFNVNENSVTLVLRNGKGEDVTISSIKIGECSGTASGSLRNDEQAAFTISGCSNAANNKFIGDLNITFTGATGLTHKNRGNLVGRVQTGSQEPPPPPTPTTLSFREDGVAANATDDAQISSSDPNTNYGSINTINVDGSGPHAHAVIKFPNIFGSGSNQIPLGATIDSATISVECFGSGDVMNTYILQEDWSEAVVTWNERMASVAWSDPGGDGPTSRGSSAVAWSCSSSGVQSFDVAAFVQSWSDGQQNYGIIITDTDSDGNDFYSSEHATGSNRPILTVTFTA